MWLPKADRTALIASETSSRKPSAATETETCCARPNQARDRSAPWLSFFQIMFNADCISPNTPERR